MRDVDKPSSSNHHHHHHKGSSSKHNGKSDLKAEARRGLEILDKIVNDVAQAKWILKGVVEHLEEVESKPPKCVNCNGSTSDRKKESPSKDKKDKDKKAKKAVLPMVSGHTVQRPKINLLRVDDQNQRSRDREPQPGRSGGNRPGGSGRVSSSVKRGRNSKDEEEERGGKKRRSASRSRSRGRSSVRSGKSKKRVSSSSSSSSSSRSKSSGSSSSSSSSSRSKSNASRATPASVKKKPSTNKDDELLSVGDSGSDVATKRKQDPKPSTSTSKPKKPSSNLEGSKTSPVHPHGSASSKFLCTAQSIESLKKKHKLKEPILKLHNVNKLMNYRTKVDLNDLKESDVKVFWTNWKAKKKEPPPKTPPPARKMIGPKSKMAGLKAKAEAESSKNEKPNTMTSAEVLRAKLREKFQKFKMQKQGTADPNQTLPDSTTNHSTNEAKPKALSLKTDSKAAHVELAAIGMSVYVTKDKIEETVNEFVGKALSERSDLLDMKRDQWTMMPNPRTGVDSIKEEVQRGIRRVIGDDDDIGKLAKHKDADDQYVLGNYYLVSRESQPLQLMRYMGSSLGDLPPCASEDDSTPRGFVPLDITSLTKKQYNSLQELGSRRASKGSRTNSDDSRIKTVKAEKNSESEDDDDEEFNVTIPTIGPEDESDVD